MTRNSWVRNVIEAENPVAHFARLLVASASDICQHLESARFCSSLEKYRYVVEHQMDDVIRVPQFGGRFNFPIYPPVHFIHPICVLEGSVPSLQRRGLSPVFGYLCDALVCRAD